MRGFFGLAVVGVGALVAGCRSASLAGPVTVAVTPHYRVGPASGDLETPKGGQPGTTSPNRPTPEEIGASLGHEVGVEVVVQKGRHEIVADGAALFLFGDATLSESLTSQASVYPAGTEVDSKTWLGVGRLAYRYLVPFRLGGETLAFRPGGGFSFFHLDYAIDGSNGAASHRVYTQFVPHLEADLAWRPGGRGPLWFSADVRQSLTFLMTETKQTNLFEGSLGVHYDLSRSWSVLLEAGWSHMGFRDVQPTPNDIDIDFGPWVGLGFTVRF